MRSVVRDELTRTLGYGVAALLISALTGGSAASASDDQVGRDWRRLWHPAFEPALGARVEMHGLRWLGDRFAITGGDDHGAVVWWSQDGIEWTRSPQSESTKRGRGTSIDGEPGSYVMIGGQGPDDGRLWLSDDGARWEPADFDPPSAMSSVVRLENGTFALYGDYSGTDEADERGCWMATSDDEGVSWQVRWGGDWDPGVEGACVYGAFRGTHGLVGIIERGISVSQDGLTWEEVVPWKSIRKLAKETPDKVRMVGLMPYDGTTFILGGSGTTTLAWSREDGLALTEGILDWRKPFDAMVAPPAQRAVAIRGRAPMVSPPTDAYGERFISRIRSAGPGRL